MKNERALRDLVTPIFSAPTVADGLVTTLRRVVELTGATAGAIAFRPRCQEPIVVTAGAKRSPAALREWLDDGRGDARGSPAAHARRSAGRAAEWRVGVAPDAARPASRRVGELVLVGRVGGLEATALPADLPQELGAALEQLGEREQRVSREAAVAEITRVLTARHTIDDLFAAFAVGAAKLVRFDSAHRWRSSTPSAVSSSSST